MQNIPKVKKFPSVEVLREGTPAEMMLSWVMNAVALHSNTSDSAAKIAAAARPFIETLALPGAEFSIANLRDYIDIASMRIDVHSIGGAEVIKTPKSGGGELMLWSADSELLIRDEQVLVAVTPNRIYEFPVYSAPRYPQYRLEVWRDVGSEPRNVYAADQLYGFAEYLPRFVVEFDYSKGKALDRIQFRQISWFGYSSGWQPLIFSK